MTIMVSSTCNECGAEVLVNRESDNYLFGRIYCEKHSVLRPMYRVGQDGRTITLVGKSE